MFDLKNIVNRIRDRGRESNPDSPAHGREDESDRNPTEGFLCPSCMGEFASQEALRTHYETIHGELLDNKPQENEGLFQAPSKDTRNIQDGPQSIKRNIDAEINAVMELTDLTELKEKLIQALRSKVLLENDKDKLEQKAAHLAERNAAMKAAADDAESSQTTLKERLKVLEAQLAHRESIDDAAVLKQELVQVQRMMDELTREKEKERDILQKDLQELQDRYSQLEQRSFNTSSYSTEKVDELSRKTQSMDDELSKVQKQLETCKFEAELAAHKAADLNIQLDQLKVQNETAEYKLEKIQNENEQLAQQMKKKDQSFREMMELKQQTIDESSARIREMEEKLEEKDREYDEIKNKLQNIVDDENRTDLGQCIDFLVGEIKSRCSRIEELNSELEKYKETIAKQESERSELVAKIQAGEGATTVIQQLTQETTSLQEKLKVFEKKEEDKNRHTKELKHQVHSINTKYQNCMKQLEIKDRELKTMETSLSNMNTNVSGLQKSLEEKEMQIEELSSCIERFRLNWGNMEMELNDLKQTVNLKFLEINSLKELNKNLITKRKEAEEKLEKQEREIETMMSDLLELREKLSNNETVLERKEEAVRGLEVIVNSQLKEIQTYSSENITLNETVESLQRTLHSNEEFIQAIGVQRTSLETNLFELQKSMADLENEKKNCEETLKTEIATLECSLKSACSEAESTKENLKQVTEHYEKLLREYNALQGDKDSREAELLTVCDRLSSDINKLKENLDTSEKKVSKLANDINSMNQNLDTAKQAHSKEMAELQSNLDEVTGEKLAIEAEMEAMQNEHKALLERFIATNGEMENLRHTVLELRRKLDESQAGLQELGRENQTLQLDLEKLTGRKWTEDSDAVQCSQCRKDFNMIVRKHHCRNCGQIFCNECSSKLAPVGNNKKHVRVCDNCYSEIMNK